MTTQCLFMRARFRPGSPMPRSVPRAGVIIPGPQEDFQRAGTEPGPLCGHNPFPSGLHAGLSPF